MGTKLENDRLVRWFLYPTLIVNLLIMVTIEPYRTAGFIYLVLAGFTLIIFSTKRFQAKVIGVKTGVLEIFGAFGVGIGTLIVFFIVSRVAPFFSIFTPTLPYAVGSDIRTFIIIFLAPITEELWRSSMLGSFMDIYKAKFWRANIFQAVVFALLHILAYGVFLGALAHWSEVYGSFYAISGSLLMALSFGLFSGWLMHKYKNVIPSIVSHMAINFWLVAQGLIIIS